MDLGPSGLLKVVFPFDQVTQSQLSKIRPRGICRGPKIGWEFPVTAAEPLLALLGNRFAVSDDLAEWLTLYQDPLPSLPAHNVLMRHADLLKPLADGRIPLPHQCSGVSWLLKRREALLADEMGLGKSVTALLGARAISRSTPISVMVIAPVGLHDHWLREATAVGVPIVLHSWARIPKDLPSSGALLIVDEAHFAQSLYANRTQSFLRLARHPCLRAIWLLTATPMKNGRPFELFPLLAAINHPLALDQKDFEKRFCRRQSSNNSALDAITLSELRILIKPFILNRSKFNLLDLPSKNRQDHIVSLSGSENIGFKHRLSIVIDDYRARSGSTLVRSEAEALVFLTAVRKISSEFKLPSVFKLVLDLLADSQSVVIFSSFISPLKLLKQNLGGDLLIGSTDLRQRNLIVERFQSGKSSLLLTTYGTGGLGLNLQKANHVILLDRPWTPADVIQAEDRCHRLGMHGNLISHWFKLGFPDKLVDGLLERKAEVIDLVFGTNSTANLSTSLIKTIDLYLDDFYK